MANTITVKGIGTVKSKADYVVISINLTGEDMDYAAAVDKANRKIALLNKALASVGFATDDLKTLNFSARTLNKSVHKGNEYTTVFAGYAVDYQLKLEFDFTPERLAQVLNAIAGSGAEAEFSISFTVKEPESVAGKLLISATENARQKAEVLVKASGKSLGELVSINYDWSELDIVSRSNYAVGAAKMMREAVPEFTPDDITSRDSVTFIWEIL